MEKGKKTGVRSGFGREYRVLGECAKTTGIVPGRGEWSPRPGTRQKGVTVTMVAKLLQLAQLGLPAPAPSSLPRVIRILVPDTAAGDNTPARRFQRGVNVLGPGFGFVHGCIPVDLSRNSG